MIIEPIGIYLNWNLKIENLNIKTLELKFKIRNNIWNNQIGNQNILDFKWKYGINLG